MHVVCLAAAFVIGNRLNLPTMRNLLIAEVHPMKGTNHTGKVTRCLSIGCLCQTSLQVYIKTDCKACSKVIIILKCSGAPFSKALVITSLEELFLFAFLYHESRSRY